MLTQHAAIRHDVFLGHFAIETQSHWTHGVRWMQDECKYVYDEVLHVYASSDEVSSISLKFIDIYLYSYNKSM